jgi:hypothetical protein
MPSFGRVRLRARYGSTAGWQRKGQRTCENVLRRLGRATFA